MFSVNLDFMLSYFRNIHHFNSLHYGYVSVQYRRKLASVSGLLVLICVNVQSCRNETMENLY